MRARSRRFIPDCIVLVTRLARDPRVPRRRKLLLLGLVGYLALPFDLVPDFIPVAGQLDDAIIVALVLRHLVRAGGEPLIRELWPGPERSLALILRLAFETVSRLLDDHLAWVGSRDDPPGVPGDLQDDEGDREADDRVGDLRAERDDDRAGDDAERDEAVDAGVVAVGDQRRAVEPATAAQPHLGGDLVAEEADHAGGGEHPEVREVLGWMRRWIVS